MNYGCPFRHIQKNTKGTEEENLCGAKPSQIKQRQGTWGHSVRQADYLGEYWCDTGDSPVVSGKFNKSVIHLHETHGVLVNWLSID